MLYKFCQLACSSPSSYYNVSLTAGKVSVELLRQDWSEEDSEADGYDPGEESGMEVEDNR